MTATDAAALVESITGHPWRAKVAASPGKWDAIVLAEAEALQGVGPRIARPARRPVARGSAFPAPPRDGRVRVGFVSPGLNVGGAERHMRDLMAWLPADRFAVAGCAVWQDSWQDAMRSEVEALAPVRFGRDAVPALYGTCDVVYCWGTVPEAQQLDRKPAGCGLVLVSHGTEAWTAQAMSTAEHADALVIVAEQSRRTVPESHRDKAVVIHNAVDPGERLRVTRDREEVRRSWGVTAPECRILGNVARVSGEKGPYCTFTAVEALRRYHMGEWVYVWVGPGAETDAIRQRSDALCPGGVFLPGAMADVGNAYNAFDAFCMPSKEDACSISMIEAMLARVPILATGIGYVAERPEFFRTLPYKPSGDAIADALLADLRDPAGTAARVESAYRHASEYLTRPRMVREWSDLLESVAAGARSRARAAKPRIPLGTPAASHAGG